MARTRYIKPGFFTNDDLANVPPVGRLLFIGLWTIADREGRLEDRPRRIKAEVLPYDDCDVDELLSSLECEGFIVRYAVSGTRCIQVINFDRHQKPHPNETPSSLPPIPDDFIPRYEALRTKDIHTSTSTLTLNELDSELGLELDLEPDSRTPKKSAQQPKRATAFPEHFEPPYAWAADELGMTTAVVDRHVRCMRDWALSKGESRKDWQAFSRNWLRKAKDDPPRASPNGQHMSAQERKRQQILAIANGEPI